jgi:hypothetical protein
MNKNGKERLYEVLGEMIDYVKGGNGGFYGFHKLCKEHDELKNKVFINPKTENVYHISGEYIVDDLLLILALPCSRTYESLEKLEKSYKELMENVI